MVPGRASRRHAACACVTGIQLSSEHFTLLSCPGVSRTSMSRDVSISRSPKTRNLWHHVSTSAPSHHSACQSDSLYGIPTDRACNLTRPAPRRPPVALMRALAEAHLLKKSRARPGKKHSRKKQATDNGRSEAAHTVNHERIAALLPQHLYGYCHCSSCGPNCLQAGSA